MLKKAQSVAASPAVSSGYFAIGLIVICFGIIALAIKFFEEDESVVDVKLNKELQNELQPIQIES